MSIFPYTHDRLWNRRVIIRSDADFFQDDGASCVVDSYRLQQSHMITYDNNGENNSDYDYECNLNLVKTCFISPSYILISLNSQSSLSLFPFISLSLPVYFIYFYLLYGMSSIKYIMPWFRVYHAQKAHVYII